MFSFKINKTQKILALIGAVVGIIGGIIAWFPNDDKINNDNKISIEGNGNNVNSNNTTYNNSGNTYVNHTETGKKQSKKVIYNNENNKYPLENKQTNLNFNSKKIVILPYEYLSDEKKYNWLSKGIPETLPETFVDAGYVVIEGVQRDKVLKEIDFQQGKYVDINTAVKIGKMLGAQEILIGSYQVNDSKIIISSRIVNVENGNVLKNTIVNHEDSLSDIFTAEKNYINSLKNKIK